jgi:hypothetical protein
MEASVTLDVELEALSGTRIVDRDRQRVVPRMPQQANAEAVALARGELSGSACRAGVLSCVSRRNGHGSSLPPRARADIGATP